MTKTSLILTAGPLLLLLTAGAVWLQAAPMIGSVTLAPTAVPVNTPTTVTVTAYIDDPLLLPESVTLYRTTPSGQTLVGQLNDKAISGDAIAGDHIFTSIILLDESYPGPITFQISAAIRGTLRRVMSSPIALTIQGLTLNGIVTNIPFIAQGTVTTLSSYVHNADIFTDLTLAVTRTIKGPTLQTPLVVKTLGGTINGQSETPPFATPLGVGQNIILLLAGPTPDGKYYLPYGPMGVFHVLTKPNNISLAIIDSAYGTGESQTPLDPSLTTLLSQSSTGSLTVDMLITALLTP